MDQKMLNFDTLIPIIIDQKIAPYVTELILILSFYLNNKPNDIDISLLKEWQAEIVKRESFPRSNPAVAAADTTALAIVDDIRAQLAAVARQQTPTDPNAAESRTWLAQVDTLINGLRAEHPALFPGG